MGTKHLEKVAYQKAKIMLGVKTLAEHYDDRHQVEGVNAYAYVITPRGNDHIAMNIRENASEEDSEDSFEDAAEG